MLLTHLSSFHTLYGVYAPKLIEIHFTHFTQPYSLYTLYAELKYITQLYAT